MSREKCLTDRERLFLIADGIEGAELVGRQGQWLELPCTWADIIVSELRAIANRMKGEATAWYNTLTTGTKRPWMFC